MTKKRRKKKKTGNLGLIIVIVLILLVLAAGAFLLLSPGGSDPAPKTAEVKPAETAEAAEAAPQTAEGSDAAPVATPEPTAAPTPTSSPTPEPTPTPVPQITLSSGSFPEDTKELTCALTEEDLPLLEGFTSLTAVHADGSVCYEALASWQESHPEVQLTYSLKIGADTVDPKTEKLDLSATEISALEDVKAVLPLLTELKTVVLHSSDSKAVTAASAKDAALPSSGTLGNGGWAVLGELESVRRDVAYRFYFTYKNKTFCVSDETISLKGIKIGDKNWQEVAAFGKYLQCTTFDMTNCGISNENMAALRDACRPTLPVWQVKLGPCTAMTDDTHIRLVKDNYTFSTQALQNLIYCEGCEYLDVGHNKLKNIDFVAGMPNLKVAILAMGYTKDISPIANCTELEFLELFTMNYLSDITPLSGLTKLKHLNLSYCNISDVSPLFGLTGLERLWIGRNPFENTSQKAELEAALPNTVIKYSHNPTGEGWRTDPDTKEWVPRYAQLQEEFDYAHPKNGGWK